MYAKKYNKKFKQAMQQAMRGKAQSTLAKPNSALLQKLPAKTHLLQAGIICLSIHRLEDVLHVIRCRAADNSLSSKRARINHHVNTGRKDAISGPRTCTQDEAIRSQIFPK